MARTLRRLLAVTCLLAGCAVPRDAVREAVRPEQPRAVAPEVSIVLHLAQRRLFVVPREHGHDTGRSVVSFPVAVGRREYATPTGEFIVEDKVEHPAFVQFDWKNPEQVFGRLAPGPGNPLGERWIGFATAHGWSIGFHGTPNPELLGQAVSHGCVRLRNADVIDLYERVRVGTPVIVRP